ncbi:hypothetical protein [Exiguobacterium sp. s194]|uniref:hypothetical protein n=1 Tax=Exiguobacterium sp. s194 TaxID=2751230 RepID=UPI001BE70AE8|nr:hypothetical protein [Exiguobacterium sp. s194]
MNYIDYKLFINFADNCIELKEVPINYDYYSFIKDNINENSEQIAIPSNIMISFLKHNFSKKRAEIVHLDFMDDDEDYHAHLDQLINQINKNREDFFILSDELSFLSDSKTVEIRSLRLRFITNNQPVDITIFINGKVSASSNEVTSDELSEMTDWLWEQVKEWI